MEDKIKYYLEKLNLEHFAPYLNSTFYLSVLAGLFFLCILLFLIFLFKTKKSDIPKRNTLKPNLEEIIDRKEIKINDDNEFVDVLVAIEEEMLAIRELYVGGYISKGIYISETDRLYEKAKVFGL
jgi:Ca2+/Na+ antiporter